MSWARPNLARLNHILIPTTKEERDRLRSTRFARIFVAPLGRAWLALSDEGRGLLGVAFVASIVGLDVLHGQNHLLWSLAFALIVASLLVRPLLRLPDVRLEVEGPARVEAGGVARFRVTLINEGERDHEALRLRRPFLPWDGSWVDGEGDVCDLPGGARRAVTQRARFVARGPHHLDAFAVSALVPLGLAVGPARESRGTRFVVVPRIARVARVDLPERMRHQAGGVALASLAGESMELVGLRPYRNGDRIRDLHARSWARVGQPMVREYQQEYFARFAVVLQAGPASVREEVLEAAVSLCAGVLARLARGEALIDLHRPAVRERALTIGRSLGGIDQALDDLAEVAPGDGFDPARAAAALHDQLDAVSALLLVTTQWDDAHRRFVAEIESCGVPCRALQVLDDGAPPLAEPRVRGIPRSAVERACEGALELEL